MLSQPPYRINRPLQKRDISTEVYIHPETKSSKKTSFKIQVQNHAWADFLGVGQVRLGLHFIVILIWQAPYSSSPLAFFG